MSKKLVSLLLAICMLFCLSACGTIEKSSKPTNAPSESQTQTQTNQSKPTSTTNQPTHTHSYSNATCTSPKKCSCGATAGTALGHQFSSATCTSPQICNRCGTTSGNELGHNYSAANCNSPKTCTRCEQTSGSALGHNYVNNKCSRCGKVDPDSLPVGLHELHVIDAGYDCKYYSGSLTDTFGNKYMGYHRFYEFGDKSYAIYNMEGKYSRFNCDVVISNERYNDTDLILQVFVDNALAFEKSGITKTTGKVHIDVSVKNGQQLKIIANDMNYGQCEAAWIVNAQLTK